MQKSPGRSQGMVGGELLPDHLQSELDVAASARSYDRIGSGNVRRVLRDSRDARAFQVGGDAGKVRVVEDVENFATCLQAESLGYL